MKIFKYALCDLIDELVDVNGAGHVWINTDFYDDLDPSTWSEATINSPVRYIAAKPYDGQNRFWLKCMPQEVPAMDLVRAFPADKIRRAAWAIAGY